MNTVNDSLLTLRQELQFLNHGGYRRTIGSRQPVFCMETSVEWRRPVFFEDSPSCAKERYEPCSTDRDCVLMDFVPIEHRHEAVPCQHIPLNENGETVAGLAKSGAEEGQIEAKVRSWLVKTIAKLESRTARP